MKSEVPAWKATVTTVLPKSKSAAALSVLGGAELARYKYTKQVLVHALTLPHARGGAGAGRLISLYIHKREKKREG